VSFQGGLRRWPQAYASPATRRNQLAAWPGASQDERMDTYRFDALVIGAGMAGATAAAHLAPTHRVALLEAEESAGYHATGRSAAIWILNYGNADTRILTGASRDFFEAPPEGFGPLAHRRAILSLAPEEQRGAMARMLSIGQGLEEITVAEARAMVPAIRPATPSAR
jgi:D-arginine dehydrogenase